MASLDILKDILQSGDFTQPEINPNLINLDKIDITRKHSLEEIRYLSSQHSINHVAAERNHQQLLEFEKKINEFELLLIPLAEYLDNFNKGLENLSKELQNLKTKSMDLTKNLEKRKELEKNYIPIVTDLIIPPDVIKEIYNSEINSKWCENLQFLTDKSLIYEKYSQDPEFTNMKSLDNLKKLLSILMNKTIERIKNFMILKIKKLRVVGTSSQNVQQELLQSKEICPFLLQHYPNLYDELLKAYIFTMRWYYRSHFTRYLTSLEKLKLNQFDQNYLIGGQQSFFQKNSNILDYTIGKRFQIINAEDPTVMLAQIAESNPLTSNIEIGFRSFNLALIDNGSVEYLFLTEFFQSKNIELINNSFDEIFQPTYTIGIQYTKRLIYQTFDIFGLLLLIRLSQSLIFELQKRKIPVIENYLNLQLITLWPNFQKLIDLNCENLKRSSLKSSAISEINSLNPHFLTIQFTNLVYGFLKLSNSNEILIESKQEPLFNSIIRLRSEFESVLTKLSKNLKSNKSEAFLYLNYNYILSFLESCEGELADLEIEHFKLLVKAFEPK